MSFYPSGASTYGPNGVRVMRFNITGEGWLDMESLRICGKLANTGANVLQVADGPHSLIQRAKLSIGGTCVEDLDLYSRNHQIFRRELMSSNFRIDDSVESGLQKVTGGVVVEEQLAAGKFARFNFQPLFGVCACGNRFDRGVELGA